MAEITAQGYVLKTQNQYFADERDLYLDIDPLWNLDPSTPDGLKAAHDAEVFGFLDEQLLLAYSSKDPDKARGIDLNILAALTGATRKSGTPSEVTLTLTGVSGTVVPAGSTVESPTDGTRWATDSDATIGVGGTVQIGAASTVNGAIQADPDTITRIVDVVAGWQSVTNPNVATPGTDEETDAALRLRRALSVGRPGNNQVDSMLGEIGNTDGVRRFRIYENDTNATDSNGLPAHSIAPIVDGGTDEDVAAAIYAKKNPGVALYAAGTPVSVDVTSPTYPTNVKTITFSRPIYIDITVAVEITDDGSLPGNVSDLVTAAVLEYAQGTLTDPDCGFNVLGFDIGENVPISRVYTPVNNVIGRYGNSYVSDLTLNGSAANVTIAFNELSRWTETNITVTVV